MPQEMPFRQDHVDGALTQLRSAGVQEHFQVAQFVDHLFAAGDKANPQCRRYRLGKAAHVQ
ncbi:hypothetical protein D3C71_2038790 [compost metagenome]